MCDQLKGDIGKLEQKILRLEEELKTQKAKESPKRSLVLRECAMIFLSKENQTKEDQKAEYPLKSFTADFQKFVEFAAQIEKDTELMRCHLSKVREDLSHKTEKSHEAKERIKQLEKTIENAQQESESLHFQQERDVRASQERSSFLSLEIQKREEIAHAIEEETERRTHSIAALEMSFQQQISEIMSEIQSLCHQLNTPYLLYVPTAVLRHEGSAAAGFPQMSIIPHPSGTGNVFTENVFYE